MAGTGGKAGAPVGRWASPSPTSHHHLHHHHHQSSSAPTPVIICNTTKHRRQQTTKHYRLPYSFRCKWPKTFPVQFLPDLGPFAHNSWTDCPLEERQICIKLSQQGEPAFWQIIVGCRTDLAQKAKNRNSWTDAPLEALHVDFFSLLILISRPPTIVPIFFILISDRICEAGGGEEEGTCPAATLLCPCCATTPANLTPESTSPPQFHITIP